MKKILALALTLALIATLSVVSFAASTNIADQNAPAQDLTVNYDAYDDATEIFSIDVQWTDTEFSYNAGSQGLWKPETHRYEGAVAAGWDADDKATVTVTNHSNAAVTATIAVNAENGFTVTSDVAIINLPTAVEKAVDAAELTGTFTLSVTAGTPNADDQIVAKPTITFAKTVAQG